MKSIIVACAVLALTAAPVRAQVARTPVDSATITLDREVYAYSSNGRRDPFASLIKSNEIRPLITDLRLSAIAFDASGGNSVAVMRDLTTNEQYRVRTGQQLGRMRVTHIGPKSVTFTLEEFGYSRQETLAMGDSTTARNTR